MKEVILYSQPECPPCEVVKMFLKEHQVNYKEINIKNDEQARNYLINQLKSYSTPTVTIDSEVISGFNLEALSAALNK
ncbi:glutaredoxin family protein [Rossellomorea vietnamensis]|jgi:glutaredoxin-like YruB-family protein|uniref:NrdH-redoxin n=1 Tax=Rossellomorea vietnamensis TaxID=218284 RepID=A0A6I6UE82_9BACI|nr:glutaredoxin family protein [Rossellomorea vietnamensis]OXS63433.1 NrdH-redoxin [Bacillus sp. DSM 27956]PRX78401.1 glutaredoxin-like YruB-family protein [Bacillus sp. V-88]QHE61114.1 NrdH-redoxin [Rossellomorea vietnamensis]SLK17906.1 Glutaredoxin-like protein, YruB-family [Bacillus sp. V-88]